MQPEDAKLTKALALKVARLDFTTFAMRAFVELEGHQLMDNWHIGAIAHELTQIENGDNRRLIVTMPPRFLKSFMISVAWPAWLLGHDPRKKLICASYAQTLSEDFSHATKRLLQSTWYKALFPKTRLDPKRTSRPMLMTTKGGYRIATSTQGALTGRGGDIIIIDDPVKAADAHSETMRDSVRNWYLSTVSSRLNDPKRGAIVLVAQRLHQQDLPGHLLEHGGWRELCLPMVEWKDRTIDLPRGLSVNREAGHFLHEKRIGEAEITRIRLEMGDRDFEAQYNQRPMPPGGTLFKLEWLKRYEKRPPPHQTELIMQSWDTAYDIQEQHDYSVCTTWAISGQQYYLLDVFREKLEFPELERAVINLRKKWNAGLVVVERAGSGISLYQNIARRNPSHWLKHLGPQRSKVDRASQQTPKFERGEIHIPNAASWLEIFEKELSEFPHGKHDDQVDSVVQFLAATDIGKHRLIAKADQARHFR